MSTHRIGERGMFARTRRHGMASAALAASFGGAAFGGIAIQTEDVKLLPIGGTERETFGSSAAIGGDTAVIGANGSGFPIVVSGGAYVFTRDDQGVWTQVQKLAASETPVDDGFGTSVAIQGETILVGAPREPDGQVDGAVYVFGPDGSGVWQERQRLRTSDPSTSVFGHSVALDGDTAAIYARVQSDGVYHGVVFVFERDGAGVWSERQIVSAADGFSLGSASPNVIALSGDTIIAGRPLDAQHGEDAGAAYVFRRGPDGLWGQEARLTASDAAPDNRFGGDVALRGDVAVIGAEDFNYPFPGITGGKAYVFTRRTDGTWTEEQLPPPADNQVGDRFGRSVAFDGVTALIGQAVDGSAGSAYVYRRDASGAWAEQVKLVASDESSSAVGTTVAVEGDRVLLGAPGDHEVALYAGAAYAYTVPALCPADVSGDGQVNTEDLNILLSGFGCSGAPGSCPGDVDEDGDTDTTDLNIVLSAFGTSCPG